MSRWTRIRPHVGFFGCGFALAAGTVYVTTNWYDIANDVFHLGVIWDTRPPWLRATMTALEWAPWVILVVLVIVRLVRGPVVRPVAFGVGIVAVWALLFTSVMLGPSVSNWRHQRAFESSAWKARAGGEPMWPTRLSMIDDLLDRYPLVGLGKDSIESLLGPRDSTGYFRDWDYVYWLGPERGLVRIDSEWLVLRFGVDGRVRERWIVRD